jgi:hypothetical protein
MEFDEGGIFYSDQQRGDADQADGESPMAARIKYREFIRTFRDGESFVYRDALRQAVSLNSPVLEIDLDHVMAWDDGATPAKHFLDSPPPPHDIYISLGGLLLCCCCCRRRRRRHRLVRGHGPPHDESAALSHVPCTHLTAASSFSSFA